MSTLHIAGNNATGTVRDPTDAERALQAEVARLRGALAAERERLGVLVKAVRDANRDAGTSLLTIGQERAWIELLAGLGWPNVGIEPPYSVGSNDGLGPVAEAKGRR